MSEKPTLTLSHPMGEGCGAGRTNLVRSRKQAIEDHFFGFPD
jgi:hypothetical protein